MAFTLSQAGMVMHWKRKGGSPMRMFVNGLGAVATGITALVVLVAKFVEGAWITALLVAVMIVCMRAVRHHYVHVDKEIDLDRPIVRPMSRSRSWWSPSTAGAASRRKRSPSPSPCPATFAACTSRSARNRTRFCRDWEKDVAAPLRDAGKCVPKLEILKSPFRYIVQPVIDYILKVERESKFHKICVLVPELVVRHWWENLLHNRRADLLKVILLMRGNRRIIVINIPWYLDKE